MTSHLLIKATMSELEPQGMSNIVFFQSTNANFLTGPLSRFLHLGTRIPSLHPPPLPPHPFFDKPTFFILQNLCCLSVIKDFTKLKKYNLQSLAAPETEKTDSIASGNSSSSSSSSSIGGKTAVKPEESSNSCQKLDAGTNNSVRSEGSAEVGEAQTEAQKEDNQL